MKKRLIALFLATMMLVGMLPTALAEEPSADAAPTVPVEETVEDKTPAADLEETPSDETPSDEALPEETPAGEAPSDEALPEESLSDEPLSEEAAPQETGEEEFLIDLQSDDGIALLADDDTPDGNLVRPATCTPADTTTTVSQTTSGVEAASFPGDKAIDGDPTTRWSSANSEDPQWITVDLGKERSVSVVKLHWERANVLAYTVQISRDNSTWTTVYTRNERITKLKETIVFDQASVRYIKVHCTGHDGQMANGSASTYKNISLYEIEAYKSVDSVPVTAAELLEDVSVSYDRDSNQVVWTTPKPIPSTYEVAIAANLEQVVGADGTVYQPLVDMPVEVAVTVSAKDGSDWATTAYGDVETYTIKGAHAASDGSNPKPAVIPEIMEWYSSPAQNGKSFTLTDTGRIVAPAALNGVAKELQADIKDLFGFEPSIVTSGAAAGDIELVIGSGDAVAGFDDETYLMEVTDSVTITAAHATGAYWGTRTLLQGMKLSEDGCSFPNGTLRDYPEFRLRGFVMDVGRKPISMDMLKTIVKNMAWYKLNDFHVHLNDNLIFMENYGVTENNYTDPAVYAQANDAYSAFRLESDITPEAGGLPLTAKDYAYTKTEFKQFIADSAARGINIVPEFDVPAHAKAIVDAFPSLRLQNVWGGQWGYSHPANCHLDLTGKYSQSLAKVQEIFDEYVVGSDPVFTGDVLDFGADEYFGGGTAYRKFMKDMIAYVKDRGYTPRLWGSISKDMVASSDATLQFTDKALNKGVQMNIWNTGWSNPTDMYNKGFDLINVTDGPFYIVPSGSGGRGVYGDYLNLTNVYDKAPNQIGGTWIPAGSSQMLGEAFAMWNDNIDTQASGLDEVDMFDRFFDVLPVAAVRMWGVGETRDRTLEEVQADAAVIGTAPQTNPYNKVARKADSDGYFKYDFTSTEDASGNDHTLTLTNAEIADGALTLTGGESYAATGLDRMGWGSQLSFTVNKTSGGGTEQVIFEADHAYGDYAIKALPVEGKSDKWKLGFSRELYDYEFNVELPVGEDVELTLATVQQSTMLYVNGGASVAAVGKFVNKGEQSNTPFYGKTGITRSSFELPVARIGSKTNAFVGTVKNVSSGVAPSVLQGEWDIPIDGYQSVTVGSTSQEEAERAIDGDTSTMWHSSYSGCTLGASGDGWIQLELKQRQSIFGLRYLPRIGRENGRILTYDVQVSTDGNRWTTVVRNGEFGTSGWQTVTFPATSARYVKLIANSSETEDGKTYVSVPELRVCATPNLSVEGKTELILPEGPFELEGDAVTPEPVVIFEGIRLEKDNDYTVSYANNTAKGEATVTVTGRGNYTGRASATFTIGGGDLSNAEKTEITFAQTAYALTGDGAVEPQPIVRYAGERLTLDVDFTVDGYTGNTAVGTGSVTVSGKGDYVGRATATFTIIAEGEVPAVKSDLSDPDKTSITFSESAYVLTGGKAEPVPTVTYDGVTLTKDKDYTVSYENNTAVGIGTVTVTGTGAYAGTASADFVITNGNTGGSGSGSGGTGSGSSGGGSGSTSTKTETEAKPDGVTVTTTTDKNSGAVSVTEKYPDGTTVNSQIPVKGVVTATVTLPKDVEKMTVVVPTLTEATAGQVAILVHPDGTEEILKDSLPAENGVEVTLTGSATLKIVDNTKQFSDVPEDSWAKESITFVTSREIFNGTGNGTFTPDSPMSRAMVCTVLANLENVDVKSDTVWYEKAVDWAKGAGVSDGTNPEAIVTREQLAVMLYRYMGSPAVEPDMYRSFDDTDQVSDWAKTAMTWAVQNSIIRGRDGSRLAPQDTATRAEVAVMFQRYIACRK